jgi:ferredoxin, 2Fe-2S
VSDTIHVTLISRDGATHEMVAIPGQTLMEAAVDHHVPGIVGTCGGSCACATCHVEIAEGWFERVGPPSAMEVSTLYFGSPRRERSRLACQVTMTAQLDGLVATVATE